jgi:hypothetical protein
MRRGVELREDGTPKFLRVGLLRLLRILELRKRGDALRCPALNFVVSAPYRAALAYVEGISQNT